MKSFFKTFILCFLVTALSGCVVTQYQNEKGESCTRRYFTVLGIPFHKCDASTAGAPIATPDTSGKEIKVAPAGPETSEYATTPADTVRQSIRATVQPAR